ncbi:unnamed protein product [Pelagomonas calceolata]|uniref:DNA-directed DNA polymerase X domain-containing protein n=1 Tax=Pelagomonas calceolata TaxID=35677 RepID=A0A8J2WTE1_9STRA|nr:unnamed protein product [Pelagomonas calceolata]|mmetsp:Transcript_3438/g.10200  ORF Transcript_3438/g.10200 Transcript_3438/m.10200 type:complete len:841 (+) Transcript_3438:164-2686(+)
MPPKKKSKTSTPATLPCFATARLTIIGANPVQRKIWAKCGGPTFLKPSQVNQLTNDRDYVVVAAAVDASIIQTKKGAALVVTDRWLTASIERNALQDAAAHAWPPPQESTEVTLMPPPGFERPVRCVAYDCDAEWVAAVRGLVRDHRPHVVLLRGASGADALGDGWRVAASSTSTAILARCEGTSLDAPEHACAWRSRAGDVFAVGDDLRNWASDRPRDDILTVFTSQNLEAAGLRDAYALLRPGRAVPATAPTEASCDSLRYGDAFAQKYGDSNPLRRPAPQETIPGRAELWTSFYGGGVHRLLDCCAASPDNCQRWGRVLALDAKRRTALRPGPAEDDVPRASSVIVFEGDHDNEAKKEAGRRTSARRGCIQAFPSEALKERSPLPVTRRVCAALSKVFKLEAARLGGDRKTRRPGEAHGTCNTQVLMFERAHAMVLSWPYQLRTDEDVYEKLVGERPYMSVDGRPARTVARALNGELDTWEACAESLRESSLNDPFETDALIASAKMAKVFGISVGDGVVDAEEKEGKLRGAYEVVQYLRKAGYGQRPSVDDAVDAMRGDEKFRAKLTQFAKHGLDRHAEFFDAPLSEAEVLEGHSLIMRGLRGADSLWRRCVPDYDHTQWVVVRVGGARRRLAGDCGHDMDFLVTHPQICSYARLKPVLDAILVGLNAERSSVDYGSGQQDLPITNYGEHVGSVLAQNTPEELYNVPVIQQIRREITGTGSGWQHWDHLARHFGVFHTKAGKRRRRIDIVVSSHLEWPFALLSWTGGKVYNRLLRDYANKIGCSLSAHCLMTVPADASSPRLVPQETHPGTPVPRTEEDVLRLLGVPWLPPHLRDV